MEVKSYGWSMRVYNLLMFKNEPITVENLHISKLCKAVDNMLLRVYEDKNVCKDEFQNEDHANMVFNKRYGNLILQDKLTAFANDIAYYSDRWLWWRFRVIEKAWQEIKAELVK